MNIFQESRVLAVLLLFLLQESRAYPDAQVQHKAVGDSLDLTCDYPKEGLSVLWKYNGTEFAEYENDQIRRLNPPLFHERLNMYKDNISITIEDLKLQDSGSFTIIALGKSVQLPTKTIALRVHDLIRDVQIKLSNSWLESENMCAFHLRCLASGDANPSYSWSGEPVKTGQNLSHKLRPAESATLTCTANNTVSIKNKTKTVVCTGKSEDSGFLMYLLIAGGIGIVALVIFGASLAVFCKWRNRTGQNESEAGITVYEDVNTEGIPKKRTESVTKGMSIYETVDDLKVTKNMPQTLYDKINFQRHPAVGPSASSPYQEVL